MATGVQEVAEAGMQASSGKEEDVEQVPMDAVAGVVEDTFLQHGERSIDEQHAAAKTAVDECPGAVVEDNLGENMQAKVEDSVKAEAATGTHPAVGDEKPSLDASCTPRMNSAISTSNGEPAAVACSADAREEGKDLASLDSKTQDESAASARQALEAASTDQGEEPAEKRPGMTADRSELMPDGDLHAEAATKQEVAQLQDQQSPADSNAQFGIMPETGKHASREARQQQQYKPTREGLSTEGDTWSAPLPGSIQVQIVKGSSSLGLSFRQRADNRNQELEVVEVLSGHAVDAHNSEQLNTGQHDRLVKPGMRLAGVNGVQRDMSAMLKALSVGEVADLSFMPAKQSPAANGKKAKDVDVALAAVRAFRAQKSRQKYQQKDVEARVPHVEQGLTGLAQALGKEFTARVQKGRDGLGMTFQFPPDGNGLLIVDIEPEGKMAQHNAEQIGNGWEDLTIQPRMLITAVNGISGASEAMVEEALSMPTRWLN